MNEDAQYIWCPGCGEIHQLLTDAMPGSDVSGRFYDPEDLICDHCKLVIATTYRRKYATRSKSESEKQ